MEQLGKIDSLVWSRRRNASALRAGLSDYEAYFILPETEGGTEGAGKYSSYLGFPVVLRDGCHFNRGRLIAHLERNGVETRPLIAGNLVAHPGMANLDHRIHGDLRNAEKAHKDGFYIGVHHRIDANSVLDVFHSFLRRF